MVVTLTTPAKQFLIHLPPTKLLRDIFCCLQNKTCEKLIMLDPIVIRENVKGVLLTFSSIERQLKYQTEQPSIAIPAELYCQWFDDVYRPDSDLWKSIFSELELRGLVAF